MAICALILCGCIDIEQELWIEADGSGHLKTTVGMPDMSDMMGDMGGQEGMDEQKAEEQKKLIEQYKKDPNVTEVTISESVKDDMMYTCTEIHFKDVEKIGPIWSKSMESAESAGGDDNKKSDAPTIKKLSNGNYQFTYTLQSEAKEGSDAENEAAKQMMQQMFQGKFYTIRIHHPEKANAKDSLGKIIDGGKTVEWKIPMADLMQPGYKQELKAELGPAGAGMMWVIILLVAVVIGVVVMMMKKKSPTPAPEAPAE
jgi:hypothetical protein